jgi:hypothetical protein
MRKVLKYACALFSVIYKFFNQKELGLRIGSCFLVFRNLSNVRYFSNVLSCS